MKKYLPGLIAMLLAITAVAFTNAPKKQIIVDGKESAKFTDPCTSPNKRWFLINLECIDQNFLSDITNASNYTLSNPTEVDNLCMGYECVCAIFACQTPTGTPIITSGTTVYAALYDFYYYGSTSAYIRTKDQYWNKR